MAKGGKTYFNLINQVQKATIMEMITMMYLFVEEM